MTEHIDWRTKQPSQVACVTSRKILNVEELETLLASTEPRAFHTTSRPEEKRRRKMQRRSTIFPERTRKLPYSVFQTRLKTHFFT